tara:strand:- start:8669 stop:9133 length:465 start_codon:yes stop_codon:yes gene_type:complete
MVSSIDSYYTYEVISMPGNYYGMSWVITAATVIDDFSGFWEYFILSRRASHTLDYLVEESDSLAEGRKLSLEYLHEIAGLNAVAMLQERLGELVDESGEDDLSGRYRPRLGPPTRFEPLLKMYLIRDFETEREVVHSKTKCQSLRHFLETLRKN